MAGRPYVLLSAAMSLDGYIDDASDARLVLSGAEDLDRVDELRASCDAILIGAGTLRRDNPRLTVRSPRRRADRAARGLPGHPARVVISGSGVIDRSARLFALPAGPGPDGAGPALVYVSDRAAQAARGELAGAATVIGAGQPPELEAVLADLAGRGIGRLLVEGGTTVLTRFLALGLADELQLAIAPFLVGEPGAARLVGPGPFASGQDRRMTLAGVSRAGDMAVLRYLPGQPQDRDGPAGGPAALGGPADA